VKVYVIPPEGPVRDEEIRDEAENELGSLDDMQSLVQGHVQMLRHPKRNDVSLWVNDDGKHMGLPMNERATSLMEGTLMPGDVIVGNMVITGADYRTGATLSVPENYDDLPKEWFE
jgi:hypothetical protein